MFIITHNTVYGFGIVIFDKYVNNQHPLILCYRTLPADIVVPIDFPTIQEAIDVSK